MSTVNEGSKKHRQVPHLLICNYKYHTEVSQSMILTQASLVMHEKVSLFLTSHQVQDGLLHTCTLHAQLQVYVFTAMDS